MLRKENHIILSKVVRLKEILNIHVIILYTNFLSFRNNIMEIKKKVEKEKRWLL